MTLQIIALSYGAGCLMFTVLTVLLLTAWKGRLQGGLLVLATALSALWCGATSANALLGIVPLSALHLLEVLRNIAWLMFLLRLLGFSWTGREGADRGLLIISASMAILCVGLLGIILAVRLSPDLPAVGIVTDQLVVLWHILIVVGILVLVEQVYRNTRPEFRWAVKYACFGIGAIFAYDLYLYSKALLFAQLDFELWLARGAVNALVVPLIAVAAARNPQWSLDVFVSRHIVFHSVALFGAGIYLVLMAVAGYYLRTFGGTWGAVAQVVFFFGALILLAVLMMSAQVRGRVRIFLSKHFYRNQYDYREEWLRFTRTLSVAEAGDALHDTVTRAIAQIVESPAGYMWVAGPDGTFRAVSRDLPDLPAQSTLGPQAPLARLMAEQGWVVFVDDTEEERELMPEFEFPDWFGELRQPWIVVPLMHGDAMLAFVVLRRSGTKVSLTWEDRDLLKTVGQQAASHMALWAAHEQLAEARQFEAFNRLSAFVVHDLKNLVAQLSLVSRNAKKHLHTPGFMEDAIETVENASNKMTRMLGQLRKGTVTESEARLIELAPMLEEVMATRQGLKPQPALLDIDDSVRVMANRDRLAAVVEHVVQNAQEATDDDGQVTVTLRRDERFAVIEVADTGCGMDAAFISDRLFRPFDTTKGNAGMGVGVYETREFLKSLGGRVEVNSQPGRGSTFELWIPLVGVTDAAVSESTTVGSQSVGMAN